MSSLSPKSASQTVGAVSVLSPLFLLLCLMLLLAACAPAPAASPTTPLPGAFPTMTLGSRLEGALPTPPPADANLLANPATAVAAASLPTATPDYAQCPPPDDTATLNVADLSAEALPGAIAGFLDQGGTNQALEQVLAAAGYTTEGAGLVRANYDLTGENTPEVMVSYTTPERGGTFLVFTCESGRYSARYQNTLGGEAPQVLRIGDMNQDQRVDVLLTSEECSEVDDLCEYRTIIITWDAALGQFVNIMNAPPDGDTVPTFGDIDNDDVLEVITVQEDNGNTQSGPLRTGSQIYDWNGESYVLSVSQPDPIRFTIQAVHEADRDFRDERMDDAARLYLYVYEESEGELGNWYGGAEVDILRSYVLYRVLLTFTYSENGDPLEAYERIRSEYPFLEDAPIYARMAEVFWQSYQETNNLNLACTQVQDYIRNRPAALDLLNRYGTRSPTYTAQTLCPF